MCISNYVLREQVRRSLLKAIEQYNGRPYVYRDEIDDTTIVAYFYGFDGIRKLRVRITRSVDK